jgi:hypothetical protein
MTSIGKTLLKRPLTQLPRCNLIETAFARFEAEGPAVDDETNEVSAHLIPTLKCLA